MEKEGPFRARSSRWPTAILKSHIAHVASSFIRTKIQLMILQFLILNSGPYLSLSSHAFFSRKGRWLQMRSFISLLPLCRMTVIQIPLFILYCPGPLLIKLAVFLSLCLLKFLWSLMNPTGVHLIRQKPHP